MILVNLYHYPIFAQPPDFILKNINRKIEGKQLGYDIVNDKVHDYLINSTSHIAIQAYTQSLVELAKITGVKIKFLDKNIHIKLFLSTPSVGLTCAFLLEIYLLPPLSVL